MATNEPRRWAAISCVHCPFENKAAQEAMLNALADAGDRYGQLTDFVMLGDLIEAGAIGSVHPNEYDHTLEDEYRAAAGYLEAIRSVLPASCRLHWTLGNHDDNLQVNDQRRTPAAVRGLIHWSQSPWADAFARWEQYPYRKPSIHEAGGCLQIGQCVVSHGWDVAQNSSRNEAFQLSYATGSWPHRLFVRGHTHTGEHVQQAHVTPKTPTHTWFCNPGTMGPLRPPYTHRRWAMWMPGVAWGECQVHHRPSRFPGKCWDAHVEVRNGGGD